MIAKIYNENYKEIGAASSYEMFIYFISIRAAAARGKIIKIYIQAVEDKETTICIDAHYEADKRKIIMEYSEANEVARAALAIK